jgi:hypothetical protein
MCRGLTLVMTKEKQKNPKMYANTREGEKADMNRPADETPVVLRAPSVSSASGKEIASQVMRNREF